MFTIRSKKPAPTQSQPLNDTQRALVEAKLEILRAASFGFTQDRLLHIQAEDSKSWTDACVAELRREIASAAPFHMKIMLIHFRELGCVSLQCRLNPPGDGDAISPASRPSRENR
jgi:hypothetical protein